VIVVDDGSTDGTWEALTAWRETHPQTNLTTLRQENARAARARNHGLRHASGDIVIFIGDDMLVAPDLVEQHMRKHIAVGEPCAVLGYASWDVRMRQTPFLRFVTEAVTSSVTAISRPVKKPPSPRSTPRISRFRAVC
jgi:glycosyltransferase involved in cell wall biosynthesis